MRRILFFTMIALSILLGVLFFLFADLPRATTVWALVAHSLFVIGVFLFMLIYTSFNKDALLPPYWQLTVVSFVLFLQLASLLLIPLAPKILTTDAFVMWSIVGLLLFFAALVSTFQVALSND